LRQSTNFGTLRITDFGRGEMRGARCLAAGRELVVVDDRRRLRGLGGLVGGDFCGAEIVEFFDLGCAECAIVEADVVDVGLNFR
jgi:hypothetical protein